MYYAKLFHSVRCFFIQSIFILVSTNLFRIPSIENFGSRMHSRAVFTDLRRFFKRFQIMSVVGSIELGEEKSPLASVLYSQNTCAVFVHLSICMAHNQIYQPFYVKFLVFFVIVGGSVIGASVVISCYQNEKWQVPVIVNLCS